MRCAILSCLCVLMVFGIGDARSFNKAHASRSLSATRFLSQLKARNLNLFKKGEGSKDEDDDGQFSLIGLHMAEYVSQCLQNAQLMQEVKDEAWQLIKDGDIAAFELQYRSTEYGPCLWIGYKLFNYENEPDSRDALDAVFTTLKEDYRCQELSDLDDKLLAIENVDTYVEVAVSYMDSHCETRGKQMMGESVSSEDLAPTATFDAIAYVGECLVKEGQMDEKCRQTAKMVKEYAETAILLYTVVNDEEEIAALFDKLQKGQELDEKEGLIFYSLIIIFNKFESIEEIFEHYNRKYTCETLKYTLGQVKGSNQPNQLSEIGKKMTGQMYNLLEKVASRDCQAKYDDDEDSDDDGKDDSDDDDDGKTSGGKGDENMPARRKVQPFNKRMQNLKKILADLLKKK